MKIERISDNQIRFIFKAQDLAERNININDILTKSTNKTQGLFQEITALLNEEYKFASLGTPLMFEATMLRDTLSVLVTKMAPDNGFGGEVNSGFTSMVGDVMAQISKNMSNKDGMNQGIDMNMSMYEPHLLNKPPNESDFNQAPPPRIDYSAFVFQNIDDLAAAVAHVDNDIYTGRSHVFKMEGKYHLLVQCIGRGCYGIKKLEKLLHEFGQKQMTSPLSYSIMQEYGEVVIADDAINKLKLYHGG